ncbi:hypothetical protein BJX62DRAFT_82330 [Aspergillus germanicus]
MPAFPHYLNNLSDSSLSTYRTQSLRCCATRHLIPNHKRKHSNHMTLPRSRPSIPVTSPLPFLITFPLGLIFMTDSASQLMNLSSKSIRELSLLRSQTKSTRATH